MLAVVSSILVATCRVDKLVSPPVEGELVPSRTAISDSAPRASTSLRTTPIALGTSRPGRLSWRADRARNSTWLGFVRTTGNAPDTLGIQLNPAGLDTGTYLDTIVVSTNNSEAEALRLPVTFTVHPCRVTAVPVDTVVSAPLDGAECGSPRATGMFARLFGFTGSAGDSVTLELQATGFDAQLVLDTSIVGGAPPLAQATACRGATGDPCITYFRLPVTGPYVVEVNGATPAASGTFVLNVAAPSTPDLPATPGQFQVDSVTPINIGALIALQSVVLSATVHDADAVDTLRLEVEMRRLGQAFTGTPTHTSGPVPNGAIARVVASVADDSSYHWRARVADQTNRRGPWMSFGANAENVADFTTNVPQPPAAPAALAQLRGSDQTPIPVGGTMSTRSAVFRGTITDADPGDQLRLEVELRPLGTAFTNVFTAQSAPLGSGSIAEITVSGLTDNTSYHWQARVVDQTGRASTWTSFGFNGEAAADFTVAVTPTQLAFLVQPSLTTAGRLISPALQVRVLDADSNTAVSFVDSIALSFGANPAAGTLSGRLKAKAVAGIATFDSVRIDRSGTGYMLAATATGLAPDTSNAFEVVPAPAMRLVFTGQPTNETAGLAISPAVVVTARDSMGNTATSFTGSVTIAFGANPGGGPLSGTTSAGAIAGVANFPNLRIRKTGTGYTLTAASGTLIGATSATFNITPAPAIGLVFTTHPSSATAGVAINPAIVVTARDSLDNTATSFTSAVTLAIAVNPNNGTLKGTPTVSAAAGVATFPDVRVDRAGVGYTLNATSGSFTATSSAFTITPAPPNRLAFTLPPNLAVAGLPISPPVEVSVQDSLGNTTPSFADSVGIAITTNPEGGTLGGVTKVLPVAGVATFDSLSINVAGSGYALSAAATGLTGATSPLFNVTPGGGTNLAFTTQPVTTTAGVAINPAVVVTVRDGEGNTATGFNGSVSVALGSNPADGTLYPPSATTVTAVSGVATFGNLRINRTGSYTLTATASGAIGATSAAFNITPAPAVAFVVTTAPSDAVAGVAINPAVVITARDSLANTATAFTGSVAMTIATGPAGGAILNGTPVTAVAGVATFGNLRLNRTGTYTLTAAAGALNVTTAAFDIAPAPPSQLVFSVQPSGANAGAPISPAVQVAARDSMGNATPIFGDSVTVAIGTNPPPGTAVLSGTLKAAASGGVATFGDLSINVAASGYTLTAVAAGLGGATSTPFNIAAATATRLEFTTQPSTTTAGVAINPSVVVRAHDDLGNTATSFTNDITIAIGNNPSGGAFRPSATTTVTPVAGVATFTNLRLDKTGSGYTLTATATDAGATSSAAFNIVPAPPLRLGFLVQPSNTVAGVAISPAVQAAAQDSLGNITPSFSGDVTVLRQTGPTGATFLDAQETTAGGVATFPTLRTTTAGSGYSLVATAAGLISSSPSSLFAVAPAGVSAALTTVTRAPTSIVASSGSTTSTITVTARDAFSNPIPGATVVLAATGTGNTLTQPGATTNASGVATGTLSSTVAQTKTVSATVNGVAITQTVTVTVTAAPAASIAVNAGNNQTATVGTAVTTDPSVIVRDQFNNVQPDVNVTFTVGSGGGTVSPTTPINTSTGGIATVTSWTLGTAAGANTLTATAAGSGISGNPITFTATGTSGAVSAAQSTVVAAPTTIAASSGAATSTITVTARDAFGNPVSGATVVLAATGSGNAITQPAAVTNSSGVATGTISSTVAEAKVVSATIGAVGVTETATVTVTSAATVSAATSTVAAAPGTIAASSGATTSTITVTARDQFGNAIPGATVVLAATGTGNTLTQPAAVTNASGVATGAISSTVAQTKTVSATINAVTVAQSATVTVTAAAAVSATQSTVARAPATIVASNGTATSVITVTAKDQFGNPMQGATVVLAATGSGNTVTQPGAITNASGVATGTLSSTVAEAKTVNATINAVAITQTAAVTVTPAAVSAAQTTVAAAPGSITASSGAATSTITVTARDAFNNPIAGATVVLAATGTGNAITQPAVTNTSGAATGTLSSTVAQPKTVSATVSAVAITQTAPVTVTAAAVSAAQTTVVAVPDSIAASSGGTASTITVTARDAFNNPVSGATVVLAATGTGNTLTQPAAVTNASGVATGTISSTVAGAKVISATANAVAATQTDTVTIIPAAVSAAQTTVSAAPASIAAGGATSTITVTARDQFNNLISGATVVLAATGTGNTLTQPAAVTNASGVATGTISSTAAEAKTVSATVSAVAITQTAIVTVTSTAVSAAQSTVAAAPASIAASSGAVTSTITVTARDANSNPIAGATVVLAATGTGNTLTQPAAVTNASGVATGTISSTVAATKTVSATIGGTAITQTATVTVTPAAASLLVFTAQPTNVTAGRAIAPNVVVAAHDPHGNTVTTFAGTVTIAIGTNPSGGAFTASATTSQAATAGVATFNNLRLNRVGTGYTLTATSGALNGTSAAFNVTAAPPTRLAFTGQPSNVTAGSPIQPAVLVAVQDSLGNTTAVTENVTVAIGTNPGSAALNGTLTVATSGGVATFGNLSINAAADGYTLTAAATGRTGATSNTFNVTPGGATNLVFTTQPSTTTAGTAITPAVVVTAQDNLGNPATSFTNNVVIAIGNNPSGGAFRPTATTTVAAVAGVAVFSNLRIDRSGNGYTLTASGSGADAATSSAFNVTPAPPQRLAFLVQPVNTIAGNAITPAVQVAAQDSLGNTTPAFGGNVTLALDANPGGDGVLTGGGSAAASGGVATFANLRINQADNGYTLIAAAAGLISGGSAAFNITPAAPSAALSTVTAAPGTITASSGASTSIITVTARDQFNNLIPGAAVVLASTGTGNTITQPAVTNASGVTTGTISSTVAQAKTISATISGVGVTQTAAVTVNPAALSAAQSTVVAAPTTIVASSGATTSTITVTARDQFNNAISGATVVLAATGTGNTLTQPAAVTNSSGVATGTLSSTVAAAKTVSATINALGVTQTATVTVTADVAASIVVNLGNNQSATVNTAVATDPSVIVRDQFNNPRSGVSVTFAVATGGGSLTGGNQTTNASGIATVASWTLGTTAGANTLTATATGSGITGNPVTFSATGNPAAVNAAQSSVAAAPGTIVASSGAATSTITVTARDAFGNPIQGATVVLAATGTGNALTQPGATTNASGVATGTISSTVAQAKTVSATINSVAVTQTAAVTVTPAAVSAAQTTVGAAPAAIAASSGAATSTITVTARDAFNNVIPGATVVLAATGSGNTLTQPAAVTNASGVATGAISSTVSEAKTVSATVSAVAITQTATVTVTPAGVGAAQSSVVAAPGTITASSGTATSTITVTARDAFDNPIAGATVVLAATGAGNAITQPAVTNASGVTTGTISSTAAGAKTVSATINAVGVTQTAAVTVTPATVAAAQSTVGAAPGTIAVSSGGATSTITVTARDQFGNAISGATVVLAASGSGNAITQPVGTTNGAGVATGTISSTFAEAKTISATANGVGITQTAALTVTVGPVSAAQTTVSAAPSTIAASAGGTTSTITVTARDQFNNPVAGATVVLAATGTGNTLTQPVGTTNASGVATGSVSSTVAATKTVSATVSAVAITQTATVTVTPAAAATIAVNGGNGQSAIVNTAVTTDPSVIVRDAFNNPVTGVNVTFTVTSGGGAITPASPATIATNASGVAALTSWVLGTTAGANAMSVTSTGLSGSPVAFTATGTPAAVSAGTSTVGAAPATIAASAGGTTSTITVTARDQFGNVIQGATVVLAATGTGNTVTQPGATTNASGVATGSISSTVAEAKTVSATINAVGVTQTAAVTVTPAAVSAAQTTVAAAPGTITASSGASASTITVTAHDAFNNPVVGATVVLAATGTGNAITQPAITNASGVTTGTISSTVAQAKTVSATINGVAITQTAAVTVTAAAAASIALNAGNGQTATVNTAVGIDPSVIVRDAFSNPVSGVSVTFTVTGGGGNITPASPATIVTNASGIAAVTAWTLGTTAGANSLSAASTGLTGTPVAFTATGTAGPATQIAIQAGNGQTATVNTAVATDPSVIVRDQFSNVVAGVSVTFTVTGGGGSTAPASPATIATTAGGIAALTSWTLGSTAGANTLSAVSTGLTGSPLTFTAVGTPGPVSAATSTVAAAPGTIAASAGGTTSTITVNARDQFSNLIQGATVVLASTGTGNTVTQPALTNGSGVATGTLSSTVAGAKTVSATINGTTVTQTAAVTVTPAAVAAAQSSVAAAPGTIAASAGATTSTITVTARDQFSNLIQGATVVLAATGTNNTLTQPAGTTNGSGVATGTLSSSVAEGKTVSATINGIGVSQTAAVTVTPAAVSAATSTVAAAPGTIAASAGGTTSTITVTARDQFANEIQGATVVLAATGGGNTVTQPVGTTNAAGVATGALSSTTAQAKTVSATINGVAITQTAAVTVTPGPAAQIAVNAGNGQTATVGTAVTTDPSVVVHDAFNNVVGGVSITFTVTGGGGSITPASPATIATNAAGVAAVTVWTVGTTAGANTLSAASAGLTGSPVVFTATGTPGAVTAAQSLVSAAPGTITASSGATTSTITVTARDQFANVIQGATVVLAATGSGNTLTQPASTTNGAGVATGTISATVAEAKTVSATINGVAVTQTAAVTVTPAAVSAAQTLVSAAPATIVASAGGTTSTITVTARDQFNNPIPDATVVLAATGSGNTLTQPAALTNAGGVTTGTLSSTVAQSKSVSATVNAVGVTQTATVTVTAAAAATIAVSAGNGQTATVNTDVATPPAALVTDAFGNPVAGVGVSFAVTAGGGTVSPGAPTINTSAAGIATLNRWTLGTTAGANTVQATSAGLAGSPLTFTATGTAGAATQIAIQAGNGQTATAGSAVATDPAVLVRDQFNNPVAGVSVTFTVTGGGGSTSPASPATIATNTSGIAAVTSWTLGTTVGANTLQAASTGLAGSPLTFTATATVGGVSAALSSVSAAPGTIAASAGGTTSTVTVTARDQFGNAIAGATVVLAATGTGNTVTQPVATTTAGGVATGTVSSTVAEAKTISATINGVGVTQTAAVTVTPAAVSAAQSTVAAAPGTIAASSGAATSTITVTARDAFGNEIPGATVVLAATGTGNTLTQPAAPTDAGGVVTGTLSSTVAQTKTLSATINAVAITQTAAVTVTVSGTVSASTSTVAAAPGTIAASAGGTTSTITVTARDQFSNLIQGATVVLAATGTNNSLTQPAGTTNGSGVATGTLSSTQAQGKTVSATINGVAITQTAAVTVTPAAAATIALNAGDGQTANVNTAVAVDPSVIVHDAFGNAVPSVSVTFTLTGGGGTIAPASPATIATNASGIATLTSWTMGTTAGTNNNTLTAASAGLSGSPVAFTASATAGPVNAGQSSMSAAPGVITASNGSSASAVTVTARDQFGNAVAGATVVIAATGSGNSITQPAGTTNAGGVATGSFSSTVAEAKTISATANGVAITQSSLVFVVPAPPSAAQSLVSAAPGTIAASSGGTTTTITVTARDAFNNPIQSAAVVLAATGTNNSITQPGVTLANGTTTGTLSSTVAQAKTISATINGVGITQTAAVTVTPAAVSAAQSLVSAAPGTIVASGGAATSTITVTARDQFSNLIQDATVVLAATGSSNSLTQPGATTDAAGEATGSLSSSVAEAKTVSATINGVGITQTAAVTVTPAAAAALVFTQQPTLATTLTDIAPPVTVLVRDAFGNTVTGFAGTVTMTIENDASLTADATLTGTNPATVVDGVATFPDLNINRTGIGYTLRATAGSLFVISAPFTIL